ncbi:MAG: T9SS type A sorting domain-containing protein [Bacteroidia bacterium]|nr:T9SS type A sorting domain-containing protein [Bacteroidia bacterium]
MKKLLLIMALNLSGYAIMGQVGPPVCNDFITVNGHDFNCGNALFYPVATTYTFRIGFNYTGAQLSDYFLMRCNSYGACDDVNQTCNYESNTATACSTEIANDLGFIHQMGFNTIRTHELGAFFYTNAWFPNQTPVDLNNILVPTVYIPAVNNATSGYGLELTKDQQGLDNQQRVFELIKEMLSQANAASLKVLLDVGYDKVSNDFNNGSSYNHIDTYCTYLTNLATYINSLPLNLKQTLMAYIIIEEPQYEGQTGNPKEVICTKTKKMYDAIKAGDQQHLISLGGTDIGEVMEWEPGVMKLDFWSPHFYPIANKSYELNSDLAVERVLGQIYWLKNNCPIPWHIGETGFSATDDEVGLAGANGWAAGHYSYPFVDGEIDATFNNPTNAFYNQANFAETVLKYVRDCNGNGITWWQYQELWNTPNFSEMIGNNYSLLRHGTVNTATFNSLKKPVVAMFENYLNSVGQPPLVDPSGSAGPPTHYYDPYNHAAIATNVYSQAHKVTGDVFDENGNPVKDAIVYGSTWTEYVVDMLTNIGTNHYDLQYTYTDANGHFELIPLNVKDQTDNTQYINYLKVGAVGKKNSDFGFPWPPPPNDLIFEPDFLNGTDIPFSVSTSALNSNYTNYDCQINNFNVYPDFYTGQQNDFQGINTLTVNNFNVHSGTYASIVELKAGNEVTIKATAASTLFNGSEVLIYNTTTLPHCIDNVGYKTGGDNDNENNRKSSKTKLIELKFAANNLKVTAQPNPSKDEFNITITDAIASAYQLKVFDSFSRLLFQTMISPVYILNLANYPAGIYFLQVQSASSLKTIKLIKQ